MIQQIKDYLIAESGCESWEEFIDSQEMGDCQGIVADIIRQFPSAHKVFGEIEVDNPSYIDNGEDWEENYRFTHHWIEVDGEVLEFSKGTLQGNIDWSDVYEIEPDEDAWRYHPISNIRKIIDNVFVL